MYTPGDAFAHTSLAQTPELRSLWAHTANRFAYDPVTAIRKANHAVAKVVRPLSKRAKEKIALRRRPKAGFPKFGSPGGF